MPSSSSSLSPSSIILQEVADLNNNGVTSLLNGDQASAIDFMTKAIKLVKSALSTSSDSTSDLHSDGKRSASILRMKAIHTVEIPCMESSDTIVFNHAIRIPAAAVTSGGTDLDHSLTRLSQFEMNIYSSAIIFNLALAHQFQASSENGEACNTKAEKLYGMVLKLLDSDTLRMHIALLIKLACINNLSQLRYSVGDYDNAREGLTQVSSFMATLQNEQHEIANNLFDEPELQGLLLNVLLLKAPTAASAA